MPGIQVTVIRIRLDEVGPVAGHGNGFVAQDLTDLRPRFGGKVFIRDLSYNPVPQHTPAQGPEGDIKKEGKQNKRPEKCTHGCCLKGAKI
jgi:hypothetical protein